MSQKHTDTSCLGEGELRHLLMDQNLTVKKLVMILAFNPGKEKEILKALPCGRGEILISISKR